MLHAAALSLGQPAPPPVGSERAALANVLPSDSAPPPPPRGGGGGGGGGGAPRTSDKKKKRRVEEEWRALMPKRSALPSRAGVKPSATPESVEANSYSARGRGTAGADRRGARRVPNDGADCIFLSAVRKKKKTRSRLQPWQAERTASVKLEGGK